MIMLGDTNTTGTVDPAVAAMQARHATSEATLEAQYTANTNHAAIIDGITKQIETATKGIAYLTSQGKNATPSQVQGACNIILGLQDQMSAIDAVIKAAPTSGSVGNLDVAFQALLDAAKSFLTPDEVTYLKSMTASQIAAAGAAQQKGMSTGTYLSISQLPSFQNASAVVLPPDGSASTSTMLAIGAGLIGLFFAFKH